MQVFNIGKELLSKETFMEAFKNLHVISEVVKDCKIKKNS